jgi:hypothetical protein
MPPLTTTLPLPPIEQDEVILTIDQARAEYANCAANTIRRKAAEGVIDARKDGTRTVYTRASIRRDKMNLPRAVLKPDPRRAALALARQAAAPDPRWTPPAAPIEVAPPWQPPEAEPQPEPQPEVARRVARRRLAAASSNEKLEV